MHGYIITFFWQLKYKIQVSLELEGHVVDLLYIESEKLAKIILH
jgi:hypothetical protein